MDHAELIVFLDTNSLLHYPCIKDIDWRSLCKADVVRLMLSRQVLKELDEKKSHPTLRDRAIRTIKEIDELIENGGKIRDKVSIEPYMKEIPASDYPQDLDPKAQDDKIICQAMTCAEENAPVKVVIVSEDINMKIRSKMFKLGVIVPAQKSRMENPTTEIERERNKAVKELNELKNKKSDIRIKISSTKERFENQFELTLCKLKSAPIDIEAEIAVKSKKLSIARPLGDTGKHVGFRDRVNRIYLTADADYDRYDKDLKLYLEKYRRYLDSQVRCQKSLLRAFEFWIKIENIGNSPAAKVQIILRFDPALQALSIEDQTVGNFPVPVKEPKEPTPPHALSVLGSLASFAMPTLDYSHVLSGVQLAGEPNICLKGDSVSGFILHFSSDRLSHHEVFIHGPIIGMFKEDVAVRPFQVLATITADELPAAVERKLNILIGDR